jgi:type I restriction-modification system DNA methylase subunit/restriction endonuclease S subunit
MVMYSCELCNKEFNQKNDYTRHIKKKQSCVSAEKMKKIITNEIKVDDSLTTFKSINKNCLDILRDNEGILGFRAVKELSYLYSFVMIQGKINDINDKLYIGGVVKTSKMFSKCVEVQDYLNINYILNDAIDDNLITNFKYAWKLILSNHNILKNIFRDNDFLELKKTSTFKKLLKKIMKYDFNLLNLDCKGEAYEDLGQSSELGQFFTPTLIKDFIVNDLIKPNILDNNMSETIFDPAMGTGGFLLSSLKYLYKKNKNVIPNIGGHEVNADTYSLCVSNLMMYLKDIPENLKLRDTLRLNCSEKWDIILSNPPFGIKSLNYDEINCDDKNEKIPIKINNGTILFLQSIIHMMKINGRCAIVLPNGQELFSTQKAIMTCRKYLMKTCKLKEVYYLPSGVFTHTGIKTCIFYFIKKKEGPEVLETKINYSKKTGKETKRSYIFEDGHKTKNIKFYDYNPYNNTKHLLVNVNIGDIVKNNYSLNYNDYIVEEKEEIDDSCNLMKLGDICDFMTKSKRQASYGKQTGKYPFYTSSQICSKFCDIPDYNNHCLIIGTGGCANIKYDNMFSCSTDNFIVINKNEITNLKFIYYYLFQKIEILEKGFSGATIKHISKKYFQNIEIPIPSIEYQNHIVSIMDFIYDENIENAKKQIKSLKKMNEIFLEEKIDSVICQNEKLEDVCDFKNGKNLSNKNVTIGIYPVIGGGKKPSCFHNVFNREQNTILCSSSGANAGYISKYDTEIWASDCFSIKSKNINIIDDIYLFKYLKNIQLNIFKLQSGTAQPHVYSRDIQNIEIPVPPIEIQNEIIRFCDRNDNLIQSLGKNIKKSQKFAKSIIENIGKIKL